jgi:hypothetical protein
VIVAASAVDGHSQKCLPHDGHDVLELVLPHDLLHHVPLRQQAVMRAADQKARRRHSRRIIRPQYVAGDLQASEFVVVKIAIESVNHPVPISPGIGPHSVIFKAVALAKMSHIEPVPRPSLAIMGRIEQLLHELRPGIRRIVLGEGFNFFGRRRQADEVEIEAANERPAVSLRRRS